MRWSKAGSDAACVPGGSQNIHRQHPLTSTNMCAHMHSTGNGTTVSQKDNKTGCWKAPHTHIKLTVNTQKPHSQCPRVQFGPAGVPHHPSVACFFSHVAHAPPQSNRLYLTLDRRVQWSGKAKNISESCLTDDNDTNAGHSVSRLGGATVMSCSWARAPNRQFTSTADDHHTQRTRGAGKHTSM